MRMLEFFSILPKPIFYIPTSAIFVAQIREPPDISESDAVSDTSQQELDRRGPLDSFSLLLVNLVRRSVERCRSGTCLVIDQGLIVL